MPDPTRAVGEARELRAPCLRGHQSIISGKPNWLLANHLPGERAYRMVRPFVAPVVETTGGDWRWHRGGAGAVPLVSWLAQVLAMAPWLRQGHRRLGDYNLGGYQAPPFSKQLRLMQEGCLKGAAMETAGYINKVIGYARGLKDAGHSLGGTLGVPQSNCRRRAAKDAGGRCSEWCR